VPAGARSSASSDLRLVSWVLSVPNFDFLVTSLCLGRADQGNHGGGRAIRYSGMADGTRPHLHYLATIAPCLDDSGPSQGRSRPRPA
jgi:hypothetical protein